MLHAHHQIKLLDFLTALHTDDVTVYYIFCNIPTSQTNGYLRNFGVSSFHTGFRYPFCATDSVDAPLSIALSYHFLTIFSIVFGKKTNFVVLYII
jgi:hypothetical protein